MGPPELDAEWDDRGIEGVSRFLNRFWNLVMDNKDKDVKASKEMIKLRHKLVYDIEYRFQPVQPQYCYFRFHGVQQ